MTTIALVHGLGGTGATMDLLADLLTSAGHSCLTVTLPGHGTTPEDLAGVTWVEWVAAIPDADVLVGQSMGGALALAAASTRPSVLGVVAINTPAPDPDALEGLEWRRSRGHEWIDGPPLAEGEAGYTRLPIDALLKMARGVLDTDLAAVTVPVLLVNSAGDEVVDPTSADTIASALGGPVTLLVLANSGHVATFGPDQDVLAAAICDFCANL